MDEKMVGGTWLGIEDDGTISGAAANMDGCEEFIGDFVRSGWSVAWTSEEQVQIGSKASDYACRHLLSRAEVKRLKALAARLQQEAQIHAQESRTQASIVKECYRAATGGRGEPGDWHGAQPVKDALADARSRAEQAERKLREAEATTAAKSDGPPATAGRRESDDE